MEQGATAKSADVIHWLFNSLREVDAVDLMKFLLQQRMWDPNEKNAGGYNALHLACITDKSLIASYLLSDCTTRIDPRAKSVSGGSPLELTSNPYIIIKLAQFGIKVSSQIIFRLLFEDIEDSEIVNLVRYLVRNGQWDTAVNGENALHQACMTSRLDCGALFSMKPSVILISSTTMVKHHSSCHQIFTLLFSMIQTFHMVKLYS